MTSNSLASHIFVIQTREDAMTVHNEMAHSMANLMLIIIRETELIKSNQLNQTAEIQNKKAAAAQEYMHLTRIVLSNEHMMMKLIPSAMSELQNLHDKLREELEKNMEVLETSRAVAEQIVRGVANDIGNVLSTNTYDNRAAMHISSTLPSGGLAIDTSL